MLEYHEVTPQTCDMGYSTGEYQIDKSLNLGQALQQLQTMLKDWGYYYYILSR